MAKLYVGGAEIGISVDDKDLEDAFSKFGRLGKVWVARKPPGFAFVEFDDERDADDAVRELDGKEVRGCVIRVEVSRRGEAGGRSSSRGGDFGGGRGGEIEMKPGDWKCPKCNVVNFARRTECFRCNEPKGRSRSRSRGRYRSRSRSPRRERRRSRSPRRRSRSPPRRRRSPSPERKRRSPSPERKRRSPSPERKRRSPSPDRKRRSPSPERKRRSPSGSPRRERDERER